MKLPNYVQGLMCFKHTERVPWFVCYFIN